MTNFEIAELIGKHAVDSFETTVSAHKWPFWLRRLAVVLFPVSIPLWIAAMVGHVVLITVMLAIVLAWAGARAMWTKE